MIFSYLASILESYWNNIFHSSHQDTASYDIIPLMKLLGYYCINIADEQEYKLRSMVAELLNSDDNITEYKNMTLVDLFNILRTSEEFINYTKVIYKDIERSIYLSKYLMKNYTRANYYDFLNELTNRELNIINSN